MKRKSNKTNTFESEQQLADGQNIRMKADAFRLAYPNILEDAVHLRDIYFILRIHKCYFDPRTMSLINLMTFSNLSQKQKINL